MAASITLTPVPSAVTSGAPGMYTRGEELELRWSVKNTAGTLTAPTDLTFTVRSPDGVDTEYVAGSDAEITDNADGTGTLVLVLDQSARWFFRCVTDTPTTAAETDVIVQRSALEDAVIPVPGDPGAAYNGAIARAASGVYSPYLATEEGEALASVAAGAGFSWQKRRHWFMPSLDPTGVTSATATLAAEFTKAAARPGSCVYVAAGAYRLDTNGLAVPEGCTFTGDECGHHAGPFTFDNAIAAAGVSGTTFYVYNTSGVTFTLGQQSRLLNVVGFYPDQERDAAPTAYGYFIQAPANAHNTTIANVTGINPYRFIYIGQATTPYAANGCRIDNIYGYPLSRGITLGRCADVARISNVHFNPGVHFEFGTTLKAWVYANATAFMIDGAEEFNFASCFAYGYRTGIEFKDEDTDGFRGCYGAWRGGGLDICERCVNVTEPNGLTLRGFKMSDVSLVPGSASGYALRFVDTHTAASRDERPAIFVNGFSVHNTHDHTVFMNTGSYGVVVLSNGSIQGSTNELLYPNSNAQVYYGGLVIPSGATLSGGTGTVTSMALAASLAL